jgi:uncharacterized membrane protein
MGIKKTFNEMSILFPLLTIYTIVYIGLMVYDFAAREAFEMPAGMMTVYIALVGAYAADKEIRRWVGKETRSRKGSFFVYVWLLFFLAAFVIYSLKAEYTLPKDLLEVALEVLAIFFGSKASKKIYEMKTEKDAAKMLGREDAVIEAIKENGKITRRDVGELLSISSSTAWRLLEEMEKKGNVEQVGQHKDAYYIISGSSKAE